MERAEWKERRSDMGTAKDKRNGELQWIGIIQLLRAEEIIKTSDNLPCCSRRKHSRTCDRLQWIACTDTCTPCTGCTEPVRSLRRRQSVADAEQDTMLALQFGQFLQVASLTGRFWAVLWTKIYSRGVEWFRICMIHLFLMKLCEWCNDDNEWETAGFQEVAIVRDVVKIRPQESWTAAAWENIWIYVNTQLFLKWTNLEQL